MSQDNRIELLKQYIIDEPEDSFSKYALALEYIKQNRDDLAETLMKDLYEKTPDYLPNYYHFGKLIGRIGTINYALEILERGIAIAKSQGNTHTMNELNGAIEELT